jgi:hypothetical protein
MSGIKETANMETQALATIEGPTLTAADIKARVNLIQQVAQAVMKPDVHYGTIPGTNKPTLYKAGAEKILATFRIAVEPVVDDLSTHDEARFRVTARATSQVDGSYLGSGVGEASSAEEKYQWRGIVHQKEWEATDESRRRVKFTRKGEEIFQVRTNVADVRNTVLKMAKKRAQIDMTLTVTGASDFFAQDLEDMPDEVREHLAGDEGGAPPVKEAPKRKRSAGRTMESKFGGKCCVCSNQIEKGDKIVYFSDDKAAAHDRCILE